MTSSAADSDPRPDASGDPAKYPARGLFVVTCMDARVDPLSVLDLRVGDAHVVRNAGGRVTDDVLRSLTLSSTLLGTRHVVVLHHTDCGLYAPSEDAVRAALADRGVDAGDMPLRTFADLEQSVRDDVAAIRTHRLVPEALTVAGYIVDVADGQLRRVEDA